MRYLVRCRNSACRHQRMTHTHPDQYILTPRCTSCGLIKGWRLEKRSRNKVTCHCNSVGMATGNTFPHKTTHPFCDKNPRGYYNQARQMGVDHDDIPVEFGGGYVEPEEKRIESCVEA